MCSLSMEQRKSMLFVDGWMFWKGFFLPLSLLVVFKICLIVYASLFSVLKGHTFPLRIQ